MATHTDSSALNYRNLPSGPNDFSYANYTDAPNAVHNTSSPLPSSPHQSTLSCSSKRLHSDDRTTTSLDLLASPSYAPGRHLHHNSILHPHRPRLMNRLLLKNLNTRPLSLNHRLINNVLTLNNLYHLYLYFRLHSTNLLPIRRFPMVQYLLCLLHFPLLQLFQLPLLYLNLLSHTVLVALRSAPHSEQTEGYLRHCHYKRSLDQSRINYLNAFSIV